MFFTYKSAVLNGKDLSVLCSKSAGVATRLEVEIMLVPYTSSPQGWLWAGISTGAMARTPTRELSTAAWLPRYRVAVCQGQASTRKLVREGSRIFLQLSGLHHFGCRHKPTRIQKEGMYIPHEGMPLSHYKKSVWNGKNFPTLENTITQFVAALTVYQLWEGEENKGSSGFLHFVA